jgi:hypothetical protein
MLIIPLKAKWRESPENGTDFKKHVITLETTTHHYQLRFQSTGKFHILETASSVASVLRWTSSLGIQELRSTGN